MGQVLARLNSEQKSTVTNEHRDDHLPDLSKWPPELSLTVLSYLNATDLYLVACIWQELAYDEMLWHSLCLSNWGYVSIYKLYKKRKINILDDDEHHQNDDENEDESENNRSNENSSDKLKNYRKLYLQLDEASITFNADPYLGMEYLFKHNLLENKPDEIARFLSHTNRLNRKQVFSYLSTNQNVFDCFVKQQNYRNVFLAKALRRLFTLIEAPNDENVSLCSLIEKFSLHFFECNPNMNLSPEMIYILCYSLIILSIDLNSPHIKNKMSKREFIRNLRKAINRTDDELFGHLYDNVYLEGHIASSFSGSKSCHH